MHNPAADLSTMTWQGFILFNLVSVILLAFWTGTQAEKIHNLKDRVHKLEEDSQATPVAVITEQLEAMRKSLESLSKDFRDFQGSVFAQAMKHGSR